ncbi:MAG: class I poly(R)-hydroxyalkanoic acid synthase, partial [Pseudomonadota bacterium]
MAEQESTASLEEMSAEFMKIMEKNQQTFAELLASPQETLSAMMDPFNALSSFGEGMRQMAMNPQKLMAANMELWQSHMNLWQETTRKMMGQESTPVAEPAKGDRRFKSADWDEHGVFDVIRQSYLITSQWLTKTMSDIDGLSDDDARKIQFHTQQMADAMSPSNFLMTNPQVIKETVASGGQNLIRGMQNLKRDLEAGDGQLKITMTDQDAFQVGENIATAPGKVVFQNDIVQLLQFEPSTEQVYERPLLIFPPWINKYYILDLQPENSFIRYAVGQGYTVFVVSWVNPDSRLAEKTMDDYLREGILASMDAVEAASGSSEMSVIGYCIGGTLTAAALAYL